MATDRKKTPDFFGEDGLDPVETATGYPQGSPEDEPATSSGAAAKIGQAVEMAVKKKAGFYLSVNILNRFTLKFHELKLAGVAIDNKSTLLEAALGFALDDMDKGEGSQVLKKIGR
ncbi:hypothetical protein D1BOALGB6SA_6493 [Olavius sp. associated proteobacterium Delta 1]|nr:hypothetical protein D1BOALGB6SA_6493 [Olavius sp. associated proteobacterium Delta 1]